MTPDSTIIPLPKNALVVLVGASGSGKSTFARRHFRETAVISSDQLRAMLADDERDQSVSRAAFELLELIVRRRLEGGRLTVVDATSTTTEARAMYLRLARAARVPAIAIVLDAPLEVCRANNAARPNRLVDEAVLRAQHDALKASLPAIATEGFDRVVVLTDQAAIEAASVRLDDAAPTR